MKLSTATVLLVSLAGSGLAAPVPPQSQSSVAISDATHAQPQTAGAELLRLVKPSTPEHAKGHEKRSRHPVVEAVVQFLDDVVDGFLCSIGLVGSRTFTTLPDDFDSIDLSALASLLSPLGLNPQAGVKAGTSKGASAGTPGQAGTGRPTEANTMRPAEANTMRPAEANTMMPAGSPNGHTGPQGAAMPPDTRTVQAGTPGSSDAAGSGKQS